MCFFTKKATIFEAVERPALRAMSRVPAVADRLDRRAARRSARPAGDRPLDLLAVDQNRVHALGAEANKILDSGTFGNRILVRPRNVLPDPAAHGDGPVAGASLAGTTRGVAASNSSRRSSPGTQRRVGGPVSNRKRARAVSATRSPPGKILTDRDEARTSTRLWRSRGRTKIFPFSSYQRSTRSRQKAR